MFQKDQTRKSALVAKNETGFNITIFLNQNQEEDYDRKSTGWLYLDDGDTFNYVTINQHQIHKVQFDPDTGLIEGINMNYDAQNFTQYQTHADLIKQIQIIGLRDSDLEKFTDTCLIDESSFSKGQFEKKELSV